MYVRQLNSYRLGYRRRLELFIKEGPGAVHHFPDSGRQYTTTAFDIERAQRTLENLEQPYDLDFIDGVIDRVEALTGEA